VSRGELGFEGFTSGEQADVRFSVHSDVASRWHHFRYFNASQSGFRHRRQLFALLRCLLGNR